MSCHRAFDIDIVAFVGGAQATEWTDFRAHYRGCADCAAEVRAWTELHEALHAGGAAGSAHPAPERLAAYAEAAHGLAVAEREAIEAHLGGCRPCTDELTTLRRFDFAALTRAAARPAALQRAAGMARGGERARRGPVARLVRHPAFAYAVVLLFLVPVALSERHLLSTPPARSLTNETAKRETAKQDAPVDVDRLEGALHDLSPRANDAAAPAAPPAERAPGAAQAPPAAARRMPSAGGEARIAAAPPPAAAKAAPAAGAASVAAARERDDRAGAAALALRADADVEVRAGAVVGALHLRVPVASFGPVEVRVVGPGKERELRQQFAAASADASAPPSLDVVVPAAWLVRGAYVVEVTPAADAGAAAAQEERAAHADGMLMKHRRESAAASRFTFTVR
ncbi:MAG TPA: hypothetical protein VGK30_07545 [Candidatus Binatia bacterium]|jgi:hypothetical protein